MSAFEFFTCPYTDQEIQFPLGPPPMDEDAFRDAEHLIVIEYSGPQYCHPDLRSLRTDDDELDEQLFDALMRLIGPSGSCGGEEYQCIKGDMANAIFAKDPSKFIEKLRSSL